MKIANLVKKWVKAMSLGDWEIRVEVVAHDSDRLLDPGIEDTDERAYSQGITHYDLNMRKALVYLADCGHDGGIEFTLVHELGHLVCNPILEEMGEDGIERLINQWAKAVLRAAGTYQEKDFDSLRG